MRFGFEDFQDESRTEMQAPIKSSTTAIVSSQSPTMGANAAPSTLS
jgi:hypothetical protein